MTEETTSILVQESLEELMAMIESEARSGKAEVDRNAFLGEHLLATQAIGQRLYNAGGETLVRHTALALMDLQIRLGGVPRFALDLDVAWQNIGAQHDR